MKSLMLASLILILVVTVSPGLCVTDPFEAGMKEFKEENYEEALQYFVQARKQDPTSSSAAFYLGLTHKIVENYKEAVPHLRDAITLTPRIREALIELVDALYQADEIKEAMEWIEVGEREGIQPARLQFLKGLLLSRGERFEEATKAFERAKELDQSLTQSVEFQIASLFMKQGKLKDAQVKFRAAANLNPATDMATYARDYESLLTQKIERERPWRFSAGLGYKYDTNVVAKPTSGPAADIISNEADHALNLSFRLAYTAPFSFNTPYNLSLQYSLNADRYFRRRDFNTITSAVTAVPGHNFKRFSVSMPITYGQSWLQQDSRSGKGPELDFLQNIHWFEDTKYLRYVSATPSVRFMLTQNSTGEVSVGLTNKYYYVNPAEPAEARDGTAYNGSLGWSYFFLEGKGVVSTRYTYTEEWTKGRNWSNEEHKVGASLLTPVAGALKFQVSGEAAFLDYVYPNFPLGKRKRNQTYNLSGGLIYAILKDTDILAQYSFVRDKSTIDIYDYKREIFTLGIEYRY